MLKILGVAVVLVVGVYILYDYRKTSNEVQLKSRHLKEMKDEYAAISRRFDMLSNELKGMCVYILHCRGFNNIPM